MNQRHEHRHGCGRVPAGCPRGSAWRLRLLLHHPGRYAWARRAECFPTDQTPVRRTLECARLFSEAQQGTGCAGRCVHQSPTCSAVRRTFPPVPAGLHDGDHRATLAGDEPVRASHGRSDEARPLGPPQDKRVAWLSSARRCQAASSRGGDGPAGGRGNTRRGDVPKELAVGERGDLCVDSRRSVRPLLRVGDGPPHSPLDATASPACECVVYWNGGHEPWMVAYSS